MNPALKDLTGNTFTGQAELWLDPAGNDAITGDCTIAVTENGLEYTWSHDGRGLLDIHGTYPASEGPDWGWYISVSQRPSGELVLQMTNITPWGESGRAVRMVTKNVAS